ncbi:hypothetical protein L873DRAFT_1844329 [Choiromyces venosus 120613-1]|uniref:Uncharacterized protein n=1 Tax=Choiromyces venosus 120613-1 TaxID=1336337 RepID=A0A3N4JJB7_9PEZI|nr:hypothetical protein L873DRAFT_1844329 [Choiromyces venosus 120613-1]
MADRGRAASQSEISAKSQTTVMVSPKAGSGPHQISLKFEQVMELAVEELVAWLQETSVFTLAGPRAPAIKDAIIFNNISGDVLLCNGHDADWLARYLPTWGASYRLSWLVSCLYDNAGIPLPTRVIPTASVAMHEQDRSSANDAIPLPTRIKPIAVTLVQEQDHSPANAVIPLPTRNEPTAVAILQEQGDSSVNAAIPIPPKIDPTLAKILPLQDHSPVYVDIHRHTYSSGYQNFRCWVSLCPAIESTWGLNLESPFPSLVQCCICPTSLLSDATHSGVQQFMTSDVSVTCGCFPQVLEQSRVTYVASSVGSSGLLMCLRRRGRITGVPLE